MMDIAVLKTPIGFIQISGENEKIVGISFYDQEPEVVDTDMPDYISSCRKQLEEYFSGQRTQFDVAISVEGTAFEKKVWKQVSGIPFGEIRTYAEIASKTGNPNATRAVGNTNKKNSIPILVPCHRVVGTGGKLTGFSGGLWRKKWLLEFEKPQRQQTLF